MKEGMKEGRKEGMKEGRKEGLTEGAHQKALEIARKLKGQGLPDEDIIEITGLTKEELSGIA
jgi:predicted transposase/invertase (TIGR01784 family)